MIKILIAEDHTIVRESLIKAISTKLPDVIFGEAENSSTAIEHVHNEKWDLLILDLKMPGRDGVDVIKDIKACQPDIPILVLSFYPEELFALRVIKAGAAGYLTKNVSLGELLKAITTILKGGQYITSSVARLMTEELQYGSTESLYKTLSDREFQVLLLIASGKSISDIALELNLSAKTIGYYQTQILHKMNLKNKFEIIHYALKLGLIE